MIENKLKNKGNNNCALVIQTVSRVNRFCTITNKMIKSWNFLTREQTYYFLLRANANICFRFLKIYALKIF